MRRVLLLITLLALVVGSATPAFAQEQRFGLVVAYPATVGIQWKLNDRVSIRGDGGFSWSSTETEPLVSTPLIPSGSGSFTTTSTLSAHQESSTTTGTIGVAALITLSRAERFSFYVAPRMAWAISSTTTEIEYDFGGLISQLPEEIRRLYVPEDFTRTQVAPTVSGLFGASVSVHERFSVFAEVGAGYSWTSQPRLQTALGSIGGDVQTRNLSLRSGVGGIIYF